MFIKFFKPLKTKLNMETQEKIRKNDFIEVEFTGKSNNEIFDTTSKKEAEQIGLGAEVKPLIICVGSEMLVKGFDEDLEGKEINKLYKLHLNPKQAFGIRNPSLIRVIPLRVFLEKKMNPVVGMTIQLDNNIAKIISVSGGRVTVDFNNLLAGKEIDYEYKIKRKILDNLEKVNALQEYFFKKKFEFDIKTDEKTKKTRVIFKDEKIKPLLEMISGKFKEMTGFDFEVFDKEIESKKTEKINKSDITGDKVDIKDKSLDNKNNLKPNTQKQQ